MKKLIGGGLALLLSVAALAAEVPAKDFARHAQFLSAKISPNGDYLAVATPVGDQVALGIVDIKGLKVTAAMHFSHGEGVDDYEWVSPSRVVTSIEVRGGPLDQPRWTGELFGMNADGSQKTYLFGYRGDTSTGSRLTAHGAKQEWGSAELLDPLPRDPEHALVAVRSWDRADVNATPSIELLDVRTGTRKFMLNLVVSAPFDVAADTAGEPRFAWGNDAKSKVLMFARNPGETQWTPVTIPGGPPESVKLYRISADGHSAFLTTGEASGRTCLREYKLESRELVDLHCHQGALGTPIMAFDGSRPIALTGEFDQPIYLDTTHPDAKLLASLQKAFPGQHLDITSQTLDGSKLLFQVESDRNPGDFYLYDRAAKKAEYLFSRRNWIDPEAMQPSTPIEYKTADQYTIHGYLTVKGGVAARNMPLVVMPHGGPHGIRDYWEWNAYAQFLASRGYAVLQPNYRGSGGYGEAHEQAGYRKWGTLMQDDLTDGVRWAIGQGIADPERVCIFGASYGGYAALMSAVRAPDLYRCAVGLAGVYDLVIHSDDSDTADTLMGRNYLARVLGTDRKLLAEQSPVTYIDKLKAHVLIAHGTADTRVPFSEAKALRRALDVNRKPYEWLEYKNEEHGFFVEANEEDFLNKLADFLDRNIGARRDATATAAAAPKP